MPPSPPPPDLNFAAVLLFLRRHGFSHSESAFFQDIIDQSSAHSHGGGTANCSSFDDDDDFVSAVSSIAEACPSDLGNDKLSHFGTAPDEIDRDFDGDPSEDKFMMTVQTGEIGPVEDLSKHELKMSEYCSNYYTFDAELVQFNKSHEKSKHDRSESGNDLTPKKIHDPNESKNNAIGDLNEDDSATADDKLFTQGNKIEDYEVFDLRIIHRKNRTGFEENKELPIVLNSVIAGRYYITEFLGSAAFSRVVQARDLCTGTDVCLKIIKNDKDFFDQSLDEIKLLKYVNKHDPADEHHILRLYDYFYHREHLFIVTELLRANLYEFQKYSQESGAEPYFTLPRLQLIALQCLNALLYLHDLGIMHCDLKPENILIKSYRRCEIKVIDLGSSCFQTDKLSLYVQSRSYRAPEVMLGLPYDQKIDVWSLGCILAELYSGEVLFPNEAVALLLARMIAMLGPIDMDMLEKGEETHKYFTQEYDLYNVNEETNEVEYIIPDESSLEHHLQISDSLFVEFLKYLLEINPERRPTVREALAHPWLSHTYENDEI